MVEYKLLFPVVFLCCISSICYYISYDFYGVFFIKLSLMIIAMFNGRSIAGCVSTWSGIFSVGYYLQSLVLLGVTIVAGVFRTGSGFSVG